MRTPLRADAEESALHPLPDLFGPAVRPERDIALLAELAARLIVCESWGDASRWTVATIQRLEPSAQLAVVTWEPHCVSGVAPPGHTSVVPIVADGLWVGALHFSASDAALHRVATLTSAAARLLGRFAHAHAVRVSLQEQAVRDPLTKLFNRGHFDHQVRAEMARATRHHKRLGLIVIDVDAFKRFNTHHGYTTGDAVLKRLAPLMADNVRASDVVCRLGGDEIAILLTDAATDIAVRRAQTLADVVRTANATQPSPLHVTITAGVAVFPDHAQTAEDLLACADRALRAGKRAGGDDVWVCDPDATGRCVRADGPVSGEVLRLVYLPAS